MRDPQTAVTIQPDRSIGQPDNGPKQFPSLILASQLHLLLMDVSLGCQVLKVSQRQCFV